jgi:endothelin-converting enzyme/putative endopeptidase
LPDQDYYISEEKDTKRKRDTKYIARMLQFIGEPAQAKGASKIVALEIEMSKPRLKGE